MFKHGEKADRRGLKEIGEAGRSGASGSGFAIGFSGNKTCDKPKKSDKVLPFNFQGFRINLISNLYVRRSF